LNVANEDQGMPASKRRLPSFFALDVIVSNAGIQIVEPLVDFDFGQFGR
jgi:hypothetical protein